MAKSELPVVEVSVALITWRRRILSVFNPRWGAFSLPMTKRRQWIAPRAPKSPRTEDWLAAATRAAAEALGRTLSAGRINGPVLRLNGYTQSDSDGLLKEYHFRVFHIPVDATVELLGGAVTEWLLTAQFADPDRVPISPTARLLVAKLAADGIV